LRVKVPSHSSTFLDLPERYPHGFFVVLDGAGTVAGEAVAKGTQVLAFGKGTVLEISSSSPDEPLDLFLAACQPLNTPWVKKLGNNGFGIFRNEQEAITITEKIVFAGKDWSYKVLEEAE
jgi:redox-sensitive bicupin YhaK (pirin superfamily)